MDAEIDDDGRAARHISKSSPLPIPDITAEDAKGAAEMIQPPSESAAPFAGDMVKVMLGRFCG